jgi:hypothetical protein
VSFLHGITNTGLPIPRPRNDGTRHQPAPAYASALRVPSHHKRRRPSGLYAGGGNTGWAEAATDGSALRACESALCLPSWTLSAGLGGGGAVTSGGRSGFSGGGTRDGQR